MAGSFALGAGYALPLMASEVRTAYISPLGRGDGLSPWRAAALSDIDGLIEEVGPGGQVLLLTHQGEFSVTEPIVITKSGSPGAPVAIAAIDHSLSPAKATIVGDRKPWTPPKDASGAVNASRFGGGTIFEFGGSVSNLSFSNLVFRNVGRIFDFSASVGEDIQITDVDFVNVRDGFYTDHASQLRHVQLVRFNGVGYSKKAVRFHGKCTDWVVSDCKLDSRWQDGDNFAVGIEAADEANGLEIQGGYTINSLDTERGNQDHYWNGDGVASERGNHSIFIKDHLSAGNSDGGYDLKSENSSLQNCVSKDNKRNFRIWGGIGLQPIVIKDSQSLSPRKRGGAGGVHHLWIQGAKPEDEEAASVLFDHCHIDGGESDTAAIHAEGSDAAVHLVDCQVTSLKDGAKLFETTDPTSVLLEGSSTSAGSTIVTSIDQLAVVGVRKTILLDATGPVTWRLDPVSRMPGVAVQGNKLSLVSETVGRQLVTVQARDRRGAASMKTLAFDVIHNPVSPGTVLALDLAAAENGDTVSDRTGLNVVRISDGAAVSGGTLRIRSPNDFASVDDFSLADLSGPFTIDLAFSLEASAPRQTGYLVSLWKPAGNRRGMALRVSQESKIEFAWCFTGKSADVQTVSGPIVALDKTYHVRVDRDDRNTVRLYVDGQMMARQNGAVGVIDTASTPLLIGGNPTSGNKVTLRVSGLEINDRSALAGSDDGYEIGDR